MKPTRTWILVTDGARARILENDGPGRGVRALQGLQFEADHARTHDLVNDRLGRSYDSHDPGRAAIEPHSDPHRALKAKFADHLAQVLAKALDTGSYDRLVVVAAPVTLGDLRAALTPKVREKVIGELSKDLTKIPDSEIGNHLGDVLPV